MFDKVRPSPMPLTGTNECHSIVNQLIEECWAHEAEKRPTMGDVCKVLETVPIPESSKSL